MSARHLLAARRRVLVCDAAPEICGCQTHDAARRYDPTGTGRTRRAFEAELVRRWRAVQRLIRRVVAEMDVFGLRQTTDSSVALGLAIAGARVGDAGLVVDQDPPPRGFAFPRSNDKVSAFNDWLYSEMRRGVLEVQQGTPMRAATEQSWMNTYIDTAYQKGIRDAYSHMNMAGESVGAAFSQPIHADRVGLLYTRTFTELEGITDATAQQISRVLAGGLAEGRAPQELAKELYVAVNDISIARSRVLARTETIRAHAEGSLNSYEEAKLEGVGVQAEFATAGDDAVCPRCAALEGKVYTIAQARGLIPVHPNCRCAYIPVVTVE